MFITGQSMGIILLNMRSGGLFNALNCSPDTARLHFSGMTAANIRPDIARIAPTSQGWQSDGRSNPGTMWGRPHWMRRYTDRRQLCHVIHDFDRLHFVLYYLHNRVPEIVYGLKVPSGQQALEYPPLHLDGVQLRGVRGQKHRYDAPAGRLDELVHLAGLVV